MERQWTQRLLLAGAGAGLAMAGAQLGRRLLAANLRGATVLLIGASRGLGLALAEEFGRQGAQLAICARRA